MNQTQCETHAVTASEAGAAAESVPPPRVEAPGATPAPAFSVHEFYRHSPTPCQTLDENGALKEVNQAWLAALNSTLGDAVGKPFESFVVPSDLEIARTVLAKLKARGEIHGVELRLLAGPEVVVTVQLEGRAMLDEQGRFLCAHCILHNITAQRQAEQELLLHQQQLAAFHHISEVMQSSQAGQEVFNTIAAEVGRMSGFPIATIELCDFKRTAMIIHGVYGMAMEGLPTPFEVPMDVALSAQVVQTGESFVGTEVSARRECAAPFLKQLGVETCLCVPIKNHGNVVGTVTLAHPQRVPVGARVITQVESLANYLGALFGWLQAREEVRRGEAELAAVYDRAPSVLCLFDERLQIVRANRAAAEFAGRDKAELINLTAAEFFHCPCVNRRNNRCFAESDCADCQLRNAVTETLLAGKAWQRVRVSKLLFRQDRCEERTVLLSTERIQVDGITRVLLCLEDVTDTERADEQIRSQAALLDITRDAIIVRDFSDTILYWNAGAQQMYGWSAEEVNGKTMSGLLLGSDTSAAVQALRTVRDQEDWTGEMKHRTRQGQEITVQSRWTLVRDRIGTPKAILVVNTDITDKKRLEAQLLRAQRLESIGTLASGLAHDLNNVLAPIMMAVHCLKEEAVADSVRTWVQTLETCSQRGADIVRQVLTFARGIEGARIPLNPKHLVQEMQRIARETFPRSIRVTSQICKQPWLIEGDATQMQQVLMNLCVNARDAMPQGGTLALLVENRELNGETKLLHPKAKPGSYVVVSVKDTGSGIPPDIMDKIFDPFFTTKPLGHGTGLGLPTVLGIAESHRGFLLVESEIGKGTAFHVYLPAARSQLSGQNGDTDQVQLPKGQGELILVVDDEPAVREITHIILSRNGYRTLLAADGREAVALFVQHRDKVKLVVTDLMMPRLDGPATLRTLREIRPDIKAVTITGLGEENRRMEAKAAGTDAFLNKPFTAQQLLKEVKRLIETKEQASN